MKTKECPECNYLDTPMTITCETCGKEFEVEDEKNIKFIEKKHILQWQDKFNIGIKKIDNQHKRILEIINQIYSLKTAHSQNRKTISKILDELDNYVVEHFTDEEHLLTSSDEKYYHQQVAEHRLFLSFVSQIRDEYKNRQFNLNSVFKFLISWFIDHTQGIDREICKHIKNN